MSGPGRFLTAALLLCLAAGARAYEPSLPSLPVPTALEPAELELLFLHRFYGSVLEEPVDSLFGTALGANVGLGARYVIIDGLQVRLLMSTGTRETDLEVAYATPLGRLPLLAQAGAQYYTTRTQGTDREGGVFLLATARTQALLRMFSPSVAVGYDVRLNHVGFGMGLVVDVAPYIALVGELYPLWRQDWQARPEEMGDEAAFALGFTLKTYGHQFTILAGNGSVVGERRMMAGVPATEGLYLGFNIQRRLQLLS